MHRIISLLAVSAVVAACAPQNTVARYSTMPSFDLWQIQKTTTSGMELALAEAELGVRGETDSYGTYLGMRTASAYQKPAYTRSAAVSGDRNCSDFSSAAAAQQFFLSAGGPTSDPHGLDRDGDGLACEWGGTIRRISTAKAAAARLAARAAARAQAAASRCYVGPRGGTYTITSGGYKDYDGC